ncbi:phage holin family protein [Sandarakinorhabdus sp.]|uniref:phage holin family protein n=1 Tax=Sandarakinorhabdus sp. TaxID=1916663 RepID=UPI0033404F78
MIAPKSQHSTQPRHLIARLLTLLQALAALTSAELKANFGSLRGPLAMLAAAMGLLTIGMTLLLVAAVLALAELVGATAATAIVAVVAAVAGLALGRTGLSRLEQANLAPRRSLAALAAQIDRFAGLANNGGNAHKDKAHD